MDGESFTRARHDATGDVHKTAEHKTRTNIDETGRRSSPYLTTMMKIFADDEHETWPSLISVKSALQPQTHSTVTLVAFKKCN